MALKALSKIIHPSLGTFDGVTALPCDLRPNPNFNGRVELAEVATFRRDFLDPKIGQIQPISVWKHPPTGQAWIIDGITRWRAAKEITDEGIGPHKDAAGNPRGAFRLKCLYLQCNSEQEAFILTVKANIRNEPKQADNVHNVAIFRYNLMMEESDIASDVYGRFTIDGKPDVKWVQEMLALNSLAPEALKALSAGKLKSSAARALAKLAPDAQRANVERLDRGERLTAANIRQNASGADVGNGCAESPTIAAATPPAARKLDKTAICAKIQEYIDFDLPKHVMEMSPENAVRTILSQLLDEFACDGRAGFQDAAVSK